MQKMILGALMISGLVAGASTLATAAPVTQAIGHDTTVRISAVEHVDYSYNHHHFKHRSWDKRHRQWHYY